MCQPECMEHVHLLICPCISMGIYECSCLCLCVPSMCVCTVYACAFQRGWVALVQLKWGCFQPRRGLVRVGKDHSFSKSWQEDHPHCVLESIMKMRCK